MNRGQHAGSTAISPDVAAVLAEVGEDHFPVRTGTPDSGPDESWHRFDQLITVDALRDRVAELAVGYENDRHVATAFLGARLLSPLARLAARPFLEQGRAVVTTAEGLWLRRHPRGWHNGLSLSAPHLVVTADDPLADEPTIEIVDAPEQLAHRAITAALELAEPVVDRLREVGALGPRALWGQFADALVSAAARRHDEGGDADAVRADIGPLLAIDDRLWVDPEIARVDVDGHVGLAWRRGSCCLAYRLDAWDYCTGCPLISRDEWWERSVASVRKRAAETSE